MVSLLPHFFLLKTRSWMHQHFSRLARLRISKWCWSVIRGLQTQYSTNAYTQPKISLEIYSFQTTLQAKEIFRCPFFWSISTTITAHDNNNNNNSHFCYLNFLAARECLCSQPPPPQGSRRDWRSCARWGRRRGRCWGRSTSRTWHLASTPAGWRGSSRVFLEAGGSQK